MGVESVDWEFIEKEEGNLKRGYVPNLKGESGITVGSGFDVGQHSKAEIDSFDISQALKEKLKNYAGVTGDEAKRRLHGGHKGFDEDMSMLETYLTQTCPAPSPIRPLDFSDQSSWYTHIFAGGITDPNCTPEAKLDMLDAIATRRRATEVRNNKGRLLRWEAPAGKGLELTDKELEQLITAVRKKKLARVVWYFDKAASAANKTGFDTLPSDAQTAITSYCWQFGQNVGALPESDYRRKAFDAAAKRDWGLYIELILTDNNFATYLSRRKKEWNLIKRSVKEEIVYQTEGAKLYAPKATAAPEATATAPAAGPE